MKILILLLWSILLIFQGNSKSATTEDGIGASVSKKLNMYIFPAKDQTDDLLVKDQDDCYQWAVKQSGVDPLNLPKVEAEQVEGGPDGSAVRGAARGAAVGAAIGAISGDAGQGAAIGAVAGGVRGRRASRVGNAMEQEGNNQAAQQKEADMINNFKKAYSACLEGKGYTVK